MTVTSFNKQDAMNPSHRKSNKFSGAYIILSSTGDALAELRTYTTDSRVYACFWGYTSIGGWTSGSGYAGGYGYHKESAACQAAINAAGYEFSEGWGGAGRGATEDALAAIATFHGIEGAKILHVHP